ncbi:hypothetical protein [Paraburkholderia hospita]|uniref:hypothetical protein n=1 Tax=Paraburkholderia hospita TaxID=169430 RepID=UPI0002719C51|nr:hypothetical protein [Paraburkholderia hospita]EUC18722.1 hypothetical protein PMI06_003098 [Burkholderia sp. BT03]SKC62166.1 hypothetical protein SAMN06266956_1242 [Paraburkholderia hospita]
MVTVDSVHAKTVDALVAYLTDCQFSESQLNVGNLVMAVEAVYEPHPRFWRDLNLMCVFDAVARVFPDWTPSGRNAPRRATSLMRELEEVLKLNAFDEANAEMLGSLPKHKRPEDRLSAADWICAEYRRKGQTTELLFAQMDGKRCGEAALEVLRCIENARAGKPFERIGTAVARWYRESVLQRRMENITS